MTAKAIHRILVIRLSAIGDVVMASALIPALRRRWPNARLAWLVEPEAAELLRHNPRIDEVIVWPRPHWQRLWHERRFGELWKAVRTFALNLRRREFDLALDCQGLLKSGLLAALSGAAVRTGLGSKEGSRLLMTRVVPAPADDPRIGSEYRRLALALGIDTEGFPMDVEPGAAARADAGQLLSGTGIDGGYAVICPFTTRPQKHWIEDRWSALIPRIERELGLPIVLLGGPGDAEASHRIAEGTNAVNLVGRSGLAAAAALIERCRLLVGVDTGLTHMGIAFDRPTVALFGSTHPYLETGTKTGRVLYHPLECSPCQRRPTCGGAYTCMQRHDVDAVLTACRESLEALT